MDTVTYPDADVQRFLQEEVVALSLNLADRDPAVLPVLRQYRVLWSPGFVVLDQRGQEIRRFLGYQPPRDFLAELRLALGKVDLLHRDNVAAHGRFRAAADLTPPAPVSAEALYWAGVAGYYRDKGDLAYLQRYWEELRDRFPESRWWTHADVF